MLAEVLASANARERRWIGKVAQMKPRVLLCPFILSFSSL